MRKRRIFLVLMILAVAGLVAVLVAGAFREREPEYGGKRLSEWVRELDIFNPVQFAQSDEALQHIGTNAIPYLLKWIRYEAAESKTKRLRRINGYLIRINPTWGLRDREWIRAERAAVALSRLRPQTDECIPELDRLLNDTNAFHGAKHAVEALVGFGEAGIPPLVARLNNGPPQWNVLIIARLGQMGTNARAAVPALQQLLSSADRSTRTRATNALRKIDPQALERAERPVGETGKKIE